MRKLISLLLALVVLLACCPAWAETTPDDATETPAEEEVALTPTEIALLGRPESEEPTHITVGNTTKVSGNFFTGMWSNNTSDIDVRTLLHGYNTVVWDSQVEFVLDPMVVSNLNTDVVRGNSVYTIRLQDDLTYCDGETAITAADYVFSLLLCASPELKALDAVSTQYSHIVGYEEYNNGETDVFAGVRLIDDYTFSITVKQEYEPFFFELSYIQVNPYPISVIAPYCIVEDDGQGAHLVSVDPEAEDVPFTEELLTETIFNDQTGYMHAPMLTSGPYMLTSYDRASGQVDFELNPFYKGNYEGVKPIIDTLTLVPVQPDTMIEQLENRDVDLLNKCVDESVILDGMALVGQGYAMENYARIGYGFCAFACEKGPQQFEAVRQAIAYSFNADSFITEFLGTFGLAVDGYYGLGQWMTLAAMGNMLPEGLTEEENAIWAEINLDELNHYEPDAAMARRLLIDDGWTLNEQGEPFDPDEDDVRYKELEDGELMRLSIRFAQAQGSEAATLVVEQLSQRLPLLGVEFLVEEVPFSELLADYYREDGERHFDMNFMATNFSAVFDPYYTFVTDLTIEGAVNTSGLRDEELMELAWDMHKTEPYDLLVYEQKWMRFQERFNEILPTMPIYSNVYFDFHTDWLQNYLPNSSYSWPVAILYAYYDEPVAVDETEPVTSNDLLITQAEEGDEVTITD